MELDVSVSGESLSITIDNPFKLEMSAIMSSIREFMSGQNINLNGLDIEGLLPRMVKGIAGCEDSCESGFFGF